MLGISLSGSKSKTKESSLTNYDRNSTGSRTVQAPSWIEDLYRGLSGDINGLGSVDPASLVPGSNPLLDQASATVGGLNPRTWNYEGALDLTRGVAQANSPHVNAQRTKDFMSDYENANLEDVVGRSLADFDFGAGQTNAQQDLDLAGSGAFGGSGAALTKSATADALARGRGSLSANLRSAAFDKALAAGAADADRRQQAGTDNARFMGEQSDRALRGAGQIADLTQQLGGEERANAGAQVDLGQILREIQGQQQGAGLGLLNSRADLLARLGLSDFFGSTETGNETGTETSKGKRSTTSFGGSVAAGK